MKKSEKKILTIIISMLILSFLSTFIMRLPSEYFMILFLAVFIIIWKWFVGINKPIKEYREDYILEMSVYVVTFFIVYYLFGLLVGLTKTNYSINNLLTIIPLTIFLIEKEIIRYQVLSKVDKHFELTALSVFLFIVFDLCYASTTILTGLEYSALVYFLSVFFPATATNIVYSTLTKKCGHIPLIFYSLIINLFVFIIPVTPIIPIDMQVMINFFLPILLWVRINYFENRSQGLAKNREYNRINLSILIVPIIIIGTMIYFYSGLFRFYAIAIGTNNMSPELSKGDIAIVDKNRTDYNKLEIGEVIAYKKGNKIMVHRIVEKTKEYSEEVFYTMSDKDPNVKKLVRKEDVVGTIHFKLRFLGYPTLWLNS